MGPREIARSKDVTANSTKKLGKAGPRPWEIEQYIYQEEPRDDQRSSHDDPRLEFALQIHGQHPDGDFIPSDGDPQSLHPACGLGATPDLHASTSSASELGTLAGHWRPSKAERDYNKNLYAGHYEWGEPEKGTSPWGRFLIFTANDHTEQMVTNARTARKVLSKIPWWHW